jgi:hypothetical protein
VKDRKDKRADLMRKVIRMVRKYVRPPVTKIVRVRIGGQELTKEMVDLRATCEPKSGWRCAKMMRFVAKYDNQARSLIGVGFLQGLPAEAQSALGKAISDGHKARPHQEKAATAKKMSEAQKAAWNRLSEAETAARIAKMHLGGATWDFRPEWEAKRKATMKRNGTSRARKRKVSERTLYAEFCVRLSTDVM